MENLSDEAWVKAHGHPNAWCLPIATNSNGARFRIDSEKHDCFVVLGSGLTESLAWENARESAPTAAEPVAATGEMNGFPVEARRDIDKRQIIMGTEAAAFHVIGLEHRPSAAEPVLGESGKDSASGKELNCAFAEIQVQSAEMAKSVIDLRNELSAVRGGAKIAFSSAAESGLEWQQRAEDAEVMQATYAAMMKRMEQALENIADEYSYHDNAHCSFGVNKKSMSEARATLAACREMGLGK